MTKDELVKAAMSMPVVRGAAEELRAQQRNAQGANPGALEEWCPPNPAGSCPFCSGNFKDHAPGCPKGLPKKRARALPPARTACGLLMDGDRLAAHISQCPGCRARSATLQVSNDGAVWVNYSGTLDGIDGYRHVRTQWISAQELEAHAQARAALGGVLSGQQSAERASAQHQFRDLKCGGGCGLSLSLAPIVTSWTCPACIDKAKAAREAPKSMVCVGAKTAPGFPCFGQRELRHVAKTEPPVLLCHGHYLHAEAKICTDGLTNVLDNAERPERLPPRRPPPLAHSYGIEDPALPDA